MKFYGIKECEHETKEDTKELLRTFSRKDFKIPPKDEESIQFDRVHRVSSRRVPSGTESSKPQPIIIKLSNFHDKSNHLSNTLQKATVLKFPTTFQRR